MTRFTLSNSFVTNLTVCSQCNEPPIPPPFPEIIFTTERPSTTEFTVPSTPPFTTVPTTPPFKTVPETTKTTKSPSPTSNRSGDVTTSLLTDTFNTTQEEKPGTVPETSQAPENSSPTSKRSENVTAPPFTDPLSKTPEPVPNKVEAWVIATSVAVTIIGLTAVVLLVPFIAVVLHIKRIESPLIANGVILRLATILYYVWQFLSCKRSSAVSPVSKPAEESLEMCNLAAIVEIDTKIHRIF